MSIEWSDDEAQVDPAAYKTEALAFGKYKGSTFLEMIVTGKTRAYLRYLLKWDELKSDTRVHITNALAEYDRRKPKGKPKAKPKAKPAKKTAKAPPKAKKAKKAKKAEEPVEEPVEEPNEEEDGEQEGDGEGDVSPTGDGTVPE